MEEIKVRQRERESEREIEREREMLKREIRTQHISMLRLTRGEGRKL